MKRKWFCRGRVRPRPSRALPGAPHPGDPEHVENVLLRKLFFQGLRRDPEFRTAAPSCYHPVLPGVCVWKTRVVPATRAQPGRCREALVPGPRRHLRASGPGLTCDVPLTALLWRPAAPRESLLGTRRSLLLGSFPRPRGVRSTEGGGPGPQTAKRAPRGPQSPRSRWEGRDCSATDACFWLVLRTTEAEPLFCRDGRTSLVESSRGLRLLFHHRFCLAQSQDALGPRPLVHCFSVVWGRELLGAAAAVSAGP